MVEQLDENVSMDFEREAIAHCNSVLSKTLPNCSFDCLGQRKLSYGKGKELDGFGYILTDSGNAGVESKENGIVPLHWNGDLCGKILPTPQKASTTKL